MAFLDEIGAKLATLGVGTVGATSDGTISLGMMPETPDICTAVYEYGGAPPDYVMGVDGIGYETPAVQVVCRGGAYDYTTPRSKAQTAYTGLTTVQAETLSGGGTSALYHFIHPQQSPFLMDRDANNRVYIACNYLCEKELSTTS